MIQTVAVLDDKNRYWEIDLELRDGSEDFVFNEQWYPGDESEAFILAARVEIKTRKGRAKTININPEYVESYVSWQKISRQL